MKTDGYSGKLWWLRERVGKSYYHYDCVKIWILSLSLFFLIILQDYKTLMHANYD